ncbi:MAG: hypothetical protein IKN11_04535 [Bacteroidales bacterium]|nr:hypothetical protein [Bacteroidales bacterium]MBR6991459.1 hypothetical protein [Bacteroidales bacterium]
MKARLISSAALTRPGYCSLAASLTACSVATLTVGTCGSTSATPPPQAAVSSAKQPAVYITISFLIDFIHSDFII